MYLYNIIIKMYRLINKNKLQSSITNIVNCYIENNSFSRWSDAVVNMSVRQD